MRLISTFLLVFIASISLTFAQGVFKFESENHDFGSVNEGVMAEYEFVFENTGDVPIVISNVRASCGCTTPTWTKEPIPPKGKGSIKAIYNSNGRPGVFNKSITVTSNASEASKTLFIKGTVVRDPSMDPKPVLAKSSFNLGKVEVNQGTTYKIKVKNEGKTQLVISDVTAACNCVKRSGNATSIAPGMEGEFEVLYTPTKEGKDSQAIVLVTNSQTTPRIGATIEAEVVATMGEGSLMRANN